MSNYFRPNQVHFTGSDHHESAAFVAAAITVVLVLVFIHVVVVVQQHSPSPEWPPVHADGAQPTAHQPPSRQPQPQPGVGHHAEDQGVCPFGRRLPLLLFVVVLVETPKNAIETCDQDGRLVDARVSQEGDVQRVRHRPGGLRGVRMADVRAGSQSGGP